MRKSSILNRWLLLCFSLSWVFTSPTLLANTSEDVVSKAQQTPHNKPALEPVSLQLKWLHQFQFAGYYAAKIKGFYEEEGLDVTIKPRDTFVNNIEQVMNGESEYGIADSIIMLYLSKGAPLSIVAPIFQHSPQVFITLKSSGVNSLYDLEGKNIAFYTKDTDGFPLLAMMNHNNIVPNLERIMIKTGPEMLLTGRVQAYPSYLSNEPYFFLKKGVKINILNPMNYGVDLYGDMLFTNLNERNKHPERVERFKRASIKGWQYALNHKEELIDYIINDLKVDKSREHLAYEANVIEEAIQPNSTPIGTLNEGRLKYIEKLFIKHNLINNKLDFSQGIYHEEIHQLTFSQQEVTWLKKHPTVKVAIDPNWAPIDFVTDKGEYQGIANEYFKYLHSFTGIKFIPETNLNWEQSVQQVKDRQLDMFSAVVNTPERRKYLNFTSPYLKFPMVIATQKGQDYIKDLTSLNNATIAVVKSYAAQELLTANYPKLTLLLVDNPKQGLEAVSQGKAFGYVDNIAVVGYHIREDGLTNIQISGETPFRADVSMAIRKDWPELQSILQKAFDSMDAQTHSELSNSWLQIDYKTQIEWRRVTFILIPILIVALMILLYNRKLKQLNNKLTQSNEQLLDIQSDLKQTNDKLETLSTTDFLTGTFNRKHIDQILEEEVSRSERYNNALSLLMIDLDNFKQINDLYGHLIGDQVLIKVSEHLSKHIRKSDTLGRWGGEEFMIICPSSDQQQALELANKLLQKIRELTFEQGFTQTASIGVATLKKQESILDFVARADSYLYKAKQLGKDQAISSETEEIIV
ncbi:diguanylate cyclase [Thiomicrorhabdus sp. Kp2]|uniref:transporter substrate-binding domain-containing diguanylate cyclase n=1 Tax=Thiomicrorhabdus sp. Kp2 TaxID=1123518 RepID=UPI000683E00A|nr:diguanylate cyclase [Thiomicrorhabdus sp. Kp2]